MKSKINLFQASMKYRQIGILITVILVIYGAYALFNMPRQEFPKFTIRQGLVIGVFPGASSAQVEDRLTKKVENYLFSFQEVDREKTYSKSKEGLMVIVVELNNDVHNSDAFWVKFRHGLNELKSQLPTEVLALVANNDFGDTSALLLTIEGKDKTYKELKTYLESLETELRKIKSISKLRRFGEINEQIGIYIQDEKLVYYGIRPLTVLTALKTEGIVTYAGELDDFHMVTPVHVPPRYQTENDIAEQIVYADPTGGLTRLKDVARIVREYKEPDSFIKTNGNKCLLLSLEMQDGENIVKFGKEVEEAAARVSKTFPPGVKIEKIADMPTVVDASVKNFLKELLIAVVAVISVTIVLLPLRVAAVAAATIPISILITLGILDTFGVELHTVSLAALVVVLGMVVDNAIVIIDNHVDKLDNGETPWDAAWKSASELFLPVFTASLAIFSAFFPFKFFLIGIAGDFVDAFPVTVAVALTTSILVAGFLVPYLNYTFIKTGLSRENTDKKKPSFLDIVQKYYNTCLEESLKHPRVVISIAIGSILLGLILCGGLPRQLFPKVERNQLAVEIYLPEGKSLAETNSVVNALESVMEKDKRVKNVTSFVGTSSPRFHTVYAPNFPAKNYAQMVVNTISNEATIQVLNEYHKKYSNYFPNAYVRMKQLDMMSAPAPIEVRISGDNIPDLKKTARQVSAILEKEKEVTWVRNDFEQPLMAIKLNIDKDAANRLGFTKSFVSMSLAVGLKGMPVATIWENDYPVDVVLKRDKNKPNDVNDIIDQYISSPFLPVAVPVRQLASISPEWTEGQIIRRNGIRTLTVRADVEQGRFASRTFSKIKGPVQGLNLPEGVTISFGGEYESELENYIPMGYSLLTSVVIIFFILLFQFKRVRLSLLIMITMPLGLLGMALGLLGVGYPFGFTAFAGLISLCGMAVRNGIILIDYAEVLRKERGFSVFDAAIAAGKRRMRPIFLTSAAAAVGVIPMILSGSPLWGPMGTVICFGLIVSMLIGLFVLPAAYLVLVKSKAYIEVQQ
jgi:multidrug efflux pump subunit AcrB